MAEDRTSRNYFTRALDENQKIDEKFRNLMHDTFDGLYSAMGKKNFLRWINTRKISDRIKELVVEEFTKEDLEKNANWGGYYTHGTNRERLREGFVNQNVASHETLHFFTDWYFTGETFPTFINEGLTEYLNREFEKLNVENENVRYTYSQNVDFVEFLHNIIGDSLIKAYLTGSSKAFSEEFSTYITEDGTINTKALDRFYNSLNRVHDVLHPNNNPKTIEEQEKSEANKKDVIENHYPMLRKITCNIVSNSIRKKAHDLEYYEDGTFNIGDAINDINELTKKTLGLLEKNGTFGLSRFSSKEDLELRDSILKNALTAVLQESHIPNDEIEGILSNAITSGSIIVQGNVMYTRYPTVNRETLLDAIDNLSGKSPIKDLIDKRLGNKEAYMNNKQFNITSFLMDASLVLDKMHVDPELRQVFLDSAILRYLPQDVNRDLVKTMIDKHSKLYVALYQKQQENKRNVVDSKFVKISDTKFIEKRDNKIFFLDYDEKVGEFSKQEIFGEYGDQIMRFPKEIVDKFGGTVKRKTYIDRNTQGRSMQYSILFNEDFSTVTVNGKSYDVISSPEKLGDCFLIDEAMKPVLDGIKNNRYVSILNDGEEPSKDASYTWIVPDVRSRVINYSLFLDELRNNAISIPKELRKDIEKAAISSLISRTYLIRPENMEELQNYISGLSLKTITDDKVANKLFSFTESLNQARRSYVEQESQYAGICFRGEDARKRWTESLKAKEERKRRAEFAQDINGFVVTDSMACIIEPLEVKTDQEHYSTMEGVKYLTKQRAQYRTAIAGKVDYDAFCDKLKDALSSVDEAKRADFITRVINNSIDMWYGSGIGYPGDDRISDERFDLSDELVEILTDRVNGNNEVDMARVDEIEERFLELSKEEETVCLEILEKRTPTGFEGVTVKRDYQAIKSIHEMKAIPEEAKTPIIQDLKAKSKTNLDDKRRMDAFARLALSGEHTPTVEDVKKASKVIDFYRDIDRD